MTASATLRSASVTREKTIADVVRDLASIYNRPSRPRLDLLAAEAKRRFAESGFRPGHSDLPWPRRSAVARRIAARAKERPTAEAVMSRANRMPGGVGWDPARPMAQVKLELLDFPDLGLRDARGDTERCSFMAATDLFSRRIVAAAVLTAPPTAGDACALFRASGAPDGTVLVRTCTAFPDAIIVEDDASDDLEPILEPFSRVGSVIVFPEYSFRDFATFDGLEVAISRRRRTTMFPASAIAVAEVARNWLRDRDGTTIPNNVEDPRARWIRGWARQPHWRHVGIVDVPSWPG